MTHLYITTDASEAEELIEQPQELDLDPKHTYHDLDLKVSETLAKRLGFRPMCSVELKGKISANNLDFIATRLVKEGLYVAIEDGNKIDTYSPPDAKTNEELIKLALQKTERVRGVNPTMCLLLYSNNPNKIRDFDSHRVGF